MWEDEKSKAILGNLLPAKEGEEKPEPPPEAPEAPIPVTTPPEEKTG
jgi:hypothetical protein